VAGRLIVCSAGLVSILLAGVAVGADTGSAPDPTISMGETDRNTTCYSWRETDTSLALLNNDRTVWQLNYDKTECKPYFHPVCLVDGTELTWLRPPDHPWHRAVWFSWKFINGLNYWEEDRKTGLSEGRTEIDSVAVNAADDFSARIEMTLSYHPPEKPAVLAETLILSVSAPDETGVYRIDWHSSFTAGDEDVLLDRTPLQHEKDGRSWGGYAGLSVRVADGTSAWQVLNSAGQRDLAAKGENAIWMDFSMQTREGEQCGFAIFDHPANLRQPSPWYVSMDTRVPFGYFSPAVLYSEAYTLPAGDTLKLRYRIVVHPGRLDENALGAEWKVWTGQ